MPPRGERVKARNKLMIKDAMEGMETREIAKKYGTQTEYTSVILNQSPEAIDFREAIQKKLDSLFEAAFQTLFDLMQDTDSDPGSKAVRLKAAQTVIERVVGKVPERYEIKSDFQTRTQGMTPEQIIEEAKYHISIIEKHKE